MGSTARYGRNVSETEPQDRCDLFKGHPPPGGVKFPASSPRGCSSLRRSTHSSSPPLKAAHKAAEDYAAQDHTKPQRPLRGSSEKPDLNARNRLHHRSICSNAGV